MTKRNMTISERFWNKVQKTETCWLWIGANDGVFGHGCMGIPGARKNIGAHRLSWRLHFGEIPDGMWVLHKCDVPACVNPDHLFLGTHNDNMRDKMLKKRALKLPEIVILGMRNCRSQTGLSYEKIGKLFFTSAMAAHRACTSHGIHFPEPI